MASAARNDPHSIEWLIELESDPHLFGFIAALRKLECIHDESPGWASPHDPATTQSG